MVSGSGDFGLAMRVMTVPDLGINGTGFVAVLMIDTLLPRPRDDVARLAMPPVDVV